MPVFAIVFAVVGVLLLLDATLQLLMPRILPESSGIRIVEAVGGILFATFGGLIILTELIA